jgi:glycosyltransferase involved in cell wall biosynthesis
MTRTAVLIPCFNASGYLPRLNEQLRNLSPPFDSVLIADDGSTDDTASVAERMGYDVIKLGKNIGPGAARNILARKTDAEWIHFHDVDDEIHSEYINIVSPAMNSLNDVIFHSVDFVDERTRERLVSWQAHDQLLDDPAKYLLHKPMGTTSSVIRREMFMNVGGFHEDRRCFEDADLHFRLALKGARISILPRVLEWSLRHSGSAGSDLGYCYRCRVEFLEDYADLNLPSLRSSIALEAEQAATILFRSADLIYARRAIRLAQSLGLRLPSSNNAFLKLLRPVVSAETLLRTQDWWRRSRS